MNNTIPKNSAQQTAACASTDRRSFLKFVTAGSVGAALSVTSPCAVKASSMPSLLRVWSCGGLSEGLHAANDHFESINTGFTISYTGASAGPLAKALTGGQGETDVFCGRNLSRGHNLVKNKFMFFFKPLCFSNYGIAVPKGNPASIKHLEDLAKKNIRLAMSPFSSAPGGKTITKILQNAQLLEAVMPQVLDPESTCVQRSVTDLLEGKADAMLVEQRVTRIAKFAPHLEFITIPDEVVPVDPRVFTVGIMTNVKNNVAAEKYVAWITSQEGQKYLDEAGFTSAISPRGQELIEKFGVKHA